MYIQKYIFKICIHISVYVCIMTMMKSNTEKKKEKPHNISGNFPGVPRMKLFEDKSNSTLEKNEK